MNGYEYEVGDFVEFIDADMHRINPYQFPAAGTVGRITKIAQDTDIRVAWPEGTTKFRGGCWTKQIRVIPASVFSGENKELDNLFSEMG